MFTVKDFKEILENLPEDMPVGLIDVTTDDTDDMNYPLGKENFTIEDYFRGDQTDDNYGTPLGKMLFITFENKLNENPI
ncbi:hypothetical protein [Chryseobacterium caseinilyticum]|uniref:Uncharacterized protein n=1 Tax=Chryseobacterium caseinilyticum TaxID=2771428 RepID=A0ABR8Z737_9FLAO|nr:hypothetical protein [Chryseobacterium caseinilyticum]MBD8081109.1 hypothetical protein [Chryseobacterium caseinilyticum]